VFLAALGLLVRLPRALNAFSPRTLLTHLFSRFPARGAGLALLGLRVMSGAAAIAVGAGYTDGWSLFWPARLVGLILAIDGLLLVLGLLTPVAGLIAPVLACAAAFDWPLPPSPWAVEIRAVALPFAAISLSLVALGPGAYSLDARIFGRKQLRIPPRLPPDQG
jgi:uncharacterized membrane protein YphA (DoxX/SURF4 family)